MSSDIKVFVKWKDQTIFAGEDVECTITFKNVAESSDGGRKETNSRRPSRPSTANAAATSAAPPLPEQSSRFSLKSPQGFFSQHARRYSFSNRKITPDRSHRVSSSIGSSFGVQHPSSHAGPPAPRSWQPNHKHKRSVSILSIDGSNVPNDRAPALLSRQRPGRNHTRSATMQALPRRNEAYENGPLKGTRYSFTRWYGRAIFEDVLSLMILSSSTKPHFTTRIAYRTSEIGRSQSYWRTC